MLSFTASLVRPYRFAFAATSSSVRYLATRKPAPPPPVYEDEDDDDEYAAAAAADEQYHAPPPTPSRRKANVAGSVAAAPTPAVAVARAKAIAMEDAFVDLATEGGYAGSYEEALPSRGKRSGSVAISGGTYPFEDEQYDYSPLVPSTQITLDATALEVLRSKIDDQDVEIKPDGIIFLPEIKYRRVLNTAFGPAGWCLVPRSRHLIMNNVISREYALFCHGRFVGVARGEQDIIPGSNMSVVTAAESTKSNALMRCCKDLGIAWELWDPQFIDKWRSKMATRAWCQRDRSTEKKLLWRRNDREFPYPWKAAK